MAIEIPFEASVDTGEGAKSLRSLKQEFKETQKELDGLNVGSEKYVATLKKLGAVRDEIGDLNAEINAFNPEGKVQAFGNVIGGLASGFQAATGAAALFGAESEDVQKALLKVQAVMAFTEGIKGLVALGDGFKVLSNIIQANPIFRFAAVITAIGAAVYAFTRSVTDNTAALEINKKAIDGLKDSHKELSDQINDSIQSQLKTAGQLTDADELRFKAQEKYEKTLEELANKRKENELAISKELDIENIGNITNKLAAQEELNRRLAEFDAEAGKVQEQAATLLNQEISAINAATYKKHKDEEDALTKKQKEEEERRTQKIRDEQKKREEDHRNHLAEIQKNIDAGTLAGFEIDQKRREEKEAQDKLNQDNALINAGIEATQLEDIKDAAAEADRQRILDTFAVEQMTKEMGLDTTRQGIVATQALFDAAFALRLGRAKKGSKEEEKIARQQFNINKGVQLGLAAIDGYKSINASLASSPVAIGPVPNPVGIASLAFAVTTSLANIAKIAATQFNSTGGGGGVAAIQAPSFGGAPALNAPQNSNTLLDPDGTVRNQQKNTPIVIQNNINETEIHKVRKRIDMIESAATIG